MANKWSLVLVRGSLAFCASLTRARVQDPSYNIANTTLLVGITSNNVVQIWAQESLQSSCESGRTQLSLQNGQFTLSPFRTWHAGGSDCHECVC